MSEPSEPKTEFDFQNTLSGAGTLKPEGLVAALSSLGFADRYQDSRAFAEGGMGEIRLCRDAQIGREVALKRIRPVRDSRELRLRFLREARVQGQLEHPSIVPVYDLGIDEHGAAYFTMKRVHGLTLRDILSGLAAGEARIVGRFSRHKLLSAFASLCLTIDFAHSRGVLHRDLKPGNIMLGDFGEIYLLDWGLAKIIGEPDPDQELGDAPEPPTAPFEATRSVVGTPGYMSPEQIRRRPLDPRSDVYSLGAILFEILTLEPLHPRGTHLERLKSTLAGAEARPSVRAPFLAIPPELEAICEQATAREPARRIGSARALHDAIESFLEGDRDLALRRKMARTHAERAVELARRAQTSAAHELEERREAMREVGRALALDPSNVSAMHTLTRLMAEPPTQLPREAEAELTRATDRQAAVNARAGAFAYAALSVFFPLYLWLGIRSWWAAGAALGFNLAAAGLCVLRMRRPAHENRWIQIPMLITSALSFIAVSRTFGAFILLPCLVLANILGWSLSPYRLRRRVFTVTGCLTLLAPLVLEWAGILSPSYSFDGGVVRILPSMTRFPPAPAWAFLVLAHLVVIVISTVFVGHVRNALTEAERKAFLQTWHLRQLVPHELEAATSPDIRLPGSAADVLTTQKNTALT